MTKVRHMQFVLRVGWIFLTHDQAITFHCRSPPIKPTFNSKKRQAVTSDQAEYVKRMRVEAYEDEIASLLEDNCQLGETM